MSKRTISIPQRVQDLLRKIEAKGLKINASKICSEALEKEALKEIEKIETPPDLRDPEVVARIIQRLRKSRKEAPMSDVK